MCIEVRSLPGDGVGISLLRHKRILRFHVCDINDYNGIVSSKMPSANI